MKTFTHVLLIVLVVPLGSKAQKVDSFFFNLYTDSLKKGTYNYINVDGKLADGRWQPLTDKELTFTCTAGTFKGNSLVVDKDFKGDSITVKAVLKENPALWRQRTIYIKKVETAERLPTVDEIMQGNTPPRRNRTKKTPGYGT